MESRPYHNNDKKDEGQAQGFERKCEAAKKEIWGRDTAVEKEGSSQINPEPLFPRVCQHETAVRRGLYLANALYYSRPLGKSSVSVRLDEKDPDWIPAPLNRLGTCEQ